jgi:hypothetical protein
MRALRGPAQGACFLAAQALPRYPERKVQLQSVLAQRFNLHRPGSGSLDLDLHLPQL